MKILVDGGIRSGRIMLALGADAVMICWSFSSATTAAAGGIVTYVESCARS
ncbi:MAG: hypothetical protein ACLTG4_07200 [Oscillospiraceae bacterium]